ncbi:hypothetical protein R70723_06470 [Paenibacillus sp. FSL R7-0273]|uniref:DUF4097 family beta strand repeat-containing protein n=1 Tax=Paenibacillus sp. FSL R7-0273 TaxID=1536772 RepID=UPI0004F6D3C1|nr:DUF4097 family beta strand repeat-containing protein [Paenibacillus sp. FSL R7-0273]AIQ45582.1 hypothetical protein R70723_06470 [Paenibacillus sp. FSL R7-0273]OMF95100.1 hypothetical protein BK144_06060 [Paenibacillus sp. FSL R7-0273]
MGRWKIGSFSAALGCIAVGVLIVLAQYNVISYDALGYLWPALLILFGLEMLIRLFIRSDVKTRVSGWGILLVIVLVLASGGQTVLAGGTLGGIFGRTQLVPLNGAIEVQSKIERVKIELPSGKVMIQGTDGNTLDYEGKLELPGKNESEAANAMEKKWKVTEEGDTLVLKLDLETNWLSNIHFGVYTKEPYLNISLPQNLAVEVETSDGAIEAGNLAGGLEVDTSNGTLDIHDITGGVDARTSNGTIAVQNVQGETELSSSNGAITLTNIDGTVSADSSNGRITVNSAVTGDWDLDSSNGKITVSLPAATNAEIKAETSNGGLKGNIAWDRDDDNQGRAVLGEGTHEVSLSTSNGTITVDTAE